MERDKYQLKQGDSRYEKILRFGDRSIFINRFYLVGAGCDQNRNSRGPKRGGIYPGERAQKVAQITWDGNAVTTANKNNGGFLLTGLCLRTASGH